MKVPAHAITKEEHDRRMKDRDRPLTDGPVQRHSVVGAPPPGFSPCPDPGQPNRRRRDRGAR